MCRLEASVHALVAHRQPQTWPAENHGNAPVCHFFPLSQASAADSEGFKTSARLTPPPPTRVFRTSHPAPDLLPFAPPPPGAAPKLERQPWPSELSSPRGWPGPAAPSPPPLPRSAPPLIPCTCLMSLGQSPSSNLAISGVVRSSYGVWVDPMC